MGKTTVVETFSKQFDQYIYLNLEILEDRKIFESDYTFDELLTALFLFKDWSKSINNTLIFIDEIQNSPKAVSSLRYFYEMAGNYFVIAAGSLLETLIDKTISFPVGRVEYLVLRPCSFKEFLGAMNEMGLINVLQEIPIPSYAHEKLMNLFRYYTLIGGMPEAVQKFIESKDIHSLNHVYESLVISYLDDVEKYARNNTLSGIIRFVIEHSFSFAGSRIKFQGFGNSKYKYREMSEAFRTLEKALLVQLVYPVTDTRLPVTPAMARAPKLQLVDTGLVNYMAGLQKSVFGSRVLSDVYEGRIAEHITGQEILGSKPSFLFKLNFWTREKNDASAEVDFVYPFHDLVIPVEVKSGSAGKLRSLNEFMDRSPHPYAVRIYSGMPRTEPLYTRTGNKYSLLNLPFYLVHKLDAYLDWFTRKEATKSQK